MSWFQGSRVFEGSGVVWLWGLGPQGLRGCLSVFRVWGSTRLGF